MRLEPVDRRSFHASGNDRDSVPHAVGDGARLLRAPRTGPRRRATPDFSIRSWGSEKQDRRRVAEVAALHPDEGADDAKLRAQVAQRSRPSRSAMPRWPSRSACSAAASSSCSATAARPPTPTIGRSTACFRRSGISPIPAVSLALEPANITAVANDVGTEAIFLRQLIAQARPEDVAIGISTSGGSRNIIWRWKRRASGRC